MAELERRIHETEEIRAVRKDEAPTRLEGYAAVYNRLSEEMWGFREQIALGAFSDVLEGDTRALWQHDSGLVFGRTRSGTLRLSENDIGLHYAVDVPDTQWARDAVVTIERGDVNQSSFGFIVADPGGERWSEEGGVLIRTIMKAEKLLDVSPVTFPAYPQTMVEARDLVKRKLAAIRGFDSSAIRAARGRALEILELEG